MEKVYITICREEPKMEQVELTEDLALKLLDKWVKILHLEEWSIRFFWKTRARDMPDGNVLGVTTANGVSRYADIQMLDPIDYDEKKSIPYDYEQTMVHELLHLTFWDMDDSGDDLRDHLTHCMVDRMARALVAAERSVGPC